MSTSKTPQEFDAYHKWLGIAPKDQPPHHYRLLGIDPFEEDRDVIGAAANRTMSYLKDLAMGDEAAHSQRLLNEVAQARLCLLNPGKKAEYDEALKTKLSLQKPPPPKKLESEPAVRTAPPPGPPPTSPPKPAVTAPAPTVAVRVEKKPIHGAGRRPYRHVPLIAGGVAVLGGVALLAVVLLTDREDPPSTSSNQGSASATASGDTIPRIEQEYAEVKAKMLAAVDPNEAAQLARQILQRYDSDDAEAHGVYGKWLCIERDRWPEGLEQLSKASDQNLRNTAAEDLNGAVEAAERLRVGNMWHQLAASDESLSGFSVRADHWYDLALNADVDSGDESSVVERAGRVLEVEPNHPKANLVIGKQLCLIEGDWVRGIERLAKGSDSALQQAARLELAGAEQAAQRAHLGDVWYDVARSDSSLEGFLHRAVYWYGIALNGADQDQAVQAASRILEVDADEPEANLVYGKHLCLSAENWQRGLPLLSKGANAELRNIAIQDLANPSTVPERVRLGDTWYQFAKSDASMAGFLPRAKHWYELALPELADADRQRVLGLLEPFLNRGEKEALVTLLQSRLTPEELADVREVLQMEQQVSPTMASSWKPLADDGELTDCHTLGPNPNAMRPAVLLWLSDPRAAAAKRISFQWKPARAYQADEKQEEAGQKGYTFAGPVSAGHFTLYKFQVRSDVDQQVELNAATYAAVGNRNALAVSVDGRRVPKNRQAIFLRRGEHVILVDLAHGGSVNPDHAWMRISLKGKESLSQMAVP